MTVRWLFVERLEAVCGAGGRMFVERLGAVCGAGGCMLDGCL